MPIRENSILSISEEMGLLKLNIEGEKSTRHSLRISQNPKYYAAQKVYLEEQISVFTKKLKTLEERFYSSETLLEESVVRQAKLQSRLNLLKNRDKIARIEALQAQIQELKDGMK